MIFQNLSLTEKKLLLLFLSALLCWWLFFAPGTCSASGTPEPMYQITESELTTLENNLAQLSSINNRLQVDLEQLGTAVQHQQQITSGLAGAVERSDAAAARAGRIEERAGAAAQSVTDAGVLIDECQQIVGRVRNRGKK